MSETIGNWRFLGPKPGSVYKQLFVKGTRIMARVLYGMYLNEEDPRSPEEIAAVFGLPVNAVHEAIAYCSTNPPEIQEDWKQEEASDRARMATQAAASNSSLR